MDPDSSTSHLLTGHVSDLQRSEHELVVQPVHTSMAPSQSSAMPEYTVIGTSEDGDSTTKSSTVKKQWATGIRLSAYANAAVLLINIVLTIVGASYGNQFSSVLVSMYQGNCAHTKRVASGLHIMINILGTILVATSSYCCQLLMAPARQDIDNAHAHRVWLPVGTFNIKMLTLLPRHRKLMWYLMFGTSIAIQLMYVCVLAGSFRVFTNRLVSFNSAVYAATSANDYGVVAVPPSFALDASQPLSDFSAPDSFESTIGRNISSLRANILADNTTFQHLNVRDLLKEYAVDTLPNRRTLVLLSNELNANTSNTTQSLYWSGSGFPVGTADVDSLPYSWMRRALNTSLYSLSNYSSASGLSVFPIIISPWPKSESFDANPLIWPPNGFVPQRNITIEGCLAETVPESCQLFINIPICVIVIVCNLIKLVCMFFAAREDRDEVLVTIGDAIASFLQRPDPNTANECMIPKFMPRLWASKVSRPYVWKSHHLRSSWRPPPRLPPPFRPEKPPTTPRQWFRATNVNLWVLTIVLTILSIMLLALLLIHADDILASFRVGFGSLNAATLLTNLSHNFVANILLVNSAQLLVTSLYFLYNDMLTRMLLAAEYNDFALERKTLRVSFPKGKQRSTFYLTIPYRYSAPALITFTVIHWLISEGFFFVQVLPFDIWGNPVSARMLNTCGYSPKALVAAVSLIVVLAFIVVGISYRKFKAPMMPLALNCSAAISAACHPPAWDRDAAFKPVMWGEVQMGLVDALGEDISHVPFRHCSFTSGEAVPPEEDCFYT